jgi:hypothetical protein
VSYSVLIFDASVKAAAAAGQELDEFKHAPISSSDMERFLARLEKYGYELESENPRSREYVKHVAGCPIQLSVFPSEIAFSVPFWKGSESAIPEALQDASELSDSETTVLFNPQTNEWEP